VKSLEEELHYIKARRGLQTFLKVSDRLRALKRRFFGANGSSPMLSGGARTEREEARTSACCSEDMCTAEKNGKSDLAIPTNPAGQRIAKQIGL
jgi:hypothetical protein